MIKHIAAYVYTLGIGAPIVTAFAGVPYQSLGWWGPVMGFGLGFSLISVCKKATGAS